MRTGLLLLALVSPHPAGGAPFDRIPHSTGLALPALEVADSLLPAIATVAPQLRAAYREAIFLPDAGGRITAVAIRFPTGSRDDLPGDEGGAFLLGQLLQEAGRQRLLSTGAELLVEVGSEEFLVTLLAPPERWRESVAILESLLYDEAPLATDPAGARAEILDILHFEAGSPVRDFEAARAALLFGAGNPAARPAMGSIPAVSSLTMGKLDAFRILHLRREAGVVAIQGPVSAADVEAMIGTPIRVLASGGPAALPPLPESFTFSPGAGAAPGSPGMPTELPAMATPVSAAPLLETSPLRIAAAAGISPAWSVGERVETDRELTSTWIAAAFPLPAGTPPLLLEFVSHLVEEALNPSPPDPGLFQIESALQWIGESPVLVISASVDPREATRWEARILGALPALAASPPTGSFFDLTRRRFRSSLLLELASPENRVRWLARAGARGNESYEIGNDLWRLDREGVSGVASGALPPRVLLIGPLGMMR